MSFSVANNEATFTNTSSKTGIYQECAIPKTKYIICFDAKSSDVSTLRIYLKDQNKTIDITSSYARYYVYFDRSDYTGTSIRLYICNETLGTTTIKNVSVINITKWFNGDIPQDLLDNPDHFSWYYNGDLSYNTGELKNCAGRYLVCTGRQQWDEYDSKSTQTPNLSSDYRDSDYIFVIPNRQYYGKSLVGNSYTGSSVLFFDKDKNYITNHLFVGGNDCSGTFTTPANCKFIKIRYYRQNLGKITISLYYTPQQGGEGYDKYYEYVAPKVYDTGTEVLRKAGSVKDTKAPSGEITRRIGIVDLGTLDWVYANNGFFKTTGLGNTIKGGATANDIPNVLTTIYTPASWSGSSDKSIYVAPDTSTSETYRLQIKDISAGTDAAAFKTAMNGVYLYYELTTPTTEQGTPFSENIEIDDYGTMYWLDTDNNLVGVPQGTKLFYPADYVLFIDSLGARAEWDASNVVVQSELSAEDSKVDSLYAIMQENIGGALRHQLVASVVAGGGTLDFNDTAWIDMGSLFWTYDGTNQVFFAVVSGMKSGHYTDTNLLSSIYKTNPVTLSSLTDMSIRYVEGQSQVYAKNTAYTSSSAFKNAMKGILLAYEKAS